ncbi:MAG: aminotransferase [Alphaproteobacteria bacterium]|nr:aminotransferase [Alphaproteobacteria bacterium]
MSETARGSEKITDDTTAHWKRLDVRHHLNPQMNYHQLKEVEGGSRIITDASGVWLTDSEGEKILDGMAGLWAVNIGYGRDDFARVAAEQMNRLAYYNSFFKTTTPPTVELAAKLAEIAPGDCNRVFFGSSGSESNDTFVRMARFYWSVQGQKKRVNFITREMAYHGSTQTGASLGGLGILHEHFGLPLPNFHHVMPPYGFNFKRAGESDEEFGLRAARAVEEKILELGPDTVAAFLGEPVIGAGGVLIPPDNYWPEVQRICREYGILFGADEVITGFGRLGRWFGCQRWGLEPDMITMAKGISSGYLPLSGLMVSDKVARVMIDSGEDFYHGYTYSGHPVACAVGLANVEAMAREKVIETFDRDIAPYFRERLIGEFADHPLVGEVRVIGGLSAVEMVADKATGKRFEKTGSVGTLCRDHCMRLGVISRGIRDAMILCPPLVISRDEVDEMIRRLRLAVDLTAKEVL